LVADIQRLKAEGGKPIMAIGGASFASSLVAANLVDEFLLSIHPVALGRGRPLFAGLETRANLALKDLKRFDTGALVEIYRPA
jgi:dihydrofolate reductase